MKATGIVRRIDDLGRVVIPKEIRRTMHIREGDSLEIYTDKDGAVILKKYSLMSGVGEFASQLCEVMNKATGRIVVITDRDSCIAVAGNACRILTDRRISRQLETLMERRQLYQYQTGVSPFLVSEDSDDFFIEIAAPILSEGDVLGSVVFSATKDTLSPDEVKSKLAQVTASFLGRHMEP